MRPPRSDSEPRSRGVSIGTRRVFASAASRESSCPGVSCGVCAGAPGGAAVVPSWATCAGGGGVVVSGGVAGKRKNQTRITRKLSTVARIRFLF